MDLRKDVSIQNDKLVRQLKHFTSKPQNDGFSENLKKVDFDGKEALEDLKTEYLNKERPMETKGDKGKGSEDAKAGEAAPDTGQE
ncbi:hypothetical protein STSP2_01834 [Anaerohalosphaera lusitana]|uniref:Uncharacterized protein n=1 Tax=Anaerohalosphaera lusitana TaxID=1936003 RepID=A0A1U9NLF9_9BACT|nr:hypothetical protein [Anaerohalosphaera lusitana]AQT68665.1 hypothetical protein STSP2_01834 [Anaerohalosphaera lusitana]